MNLWTDPWLVVRRLNGTRSRVRLADLGAVDVVAFDADRADFNGAQAQAAIAVLQTVAAVDGGAAWRQRLQSPPDADTLGALLAPLAAHFKLDGDGPRFMQDATLATAGGEPVPIANLLIETPGENTLRHNGDHFIKRHQVQRICPCCAALALVTLQLNAPAGGAGHRTSLRGGGPLTTLLLAPATPDTPRSLWHSLWLNVLPTSRFESRNGDVRHVSPDLSFPWLGKVDSLQPPGGQTTPTQTHPLHVYWATPRRIWLDFAHTEAGVCDLCGEAGQALLTRYFTRPHGYNYKGPWRHPLTPYYESKEGWLPMHPQPGGIGYRHWQALVLGLHNDKRAIAAAEVVNQFLQSPTERRTGIGLHLWAFGYDMDNMKARGWYEATLPLHDLAACDEGARTALRDAVTAWLAAADLAASYLRSAVKSTWFGAADARGDFSHVDAAFWSRTEPLFYALLARTIAALRDQTARDPLADNTQWLAQLQAAAIGLFAHEFVGVGRIEREQPRRVVAAEVDLRKKLHGPKLREAAALPPLAKITPSRAAEKASRNPRPSI